MMVNLKHYTHTLSLKRAFEVESVLGLGEGYSAQGRREQGRGSGAPSSFRFFLILTSKLTPNLTYIIYNYDGET